MKKQLENEIVTAYPHGLTWQKSIATFHPESADEISDIFHRMRTHRQTGAISGFGNNIDPIGKPFSDMLIIKSDRLNGIIDINEKNHIVTVGSGYPLMEINKSLASHGLWFPFGDINYAGSFGGALAAGLSGNNGTHAIRLSRYLLSVTAILPDGSIIDSGSPMDKSISGYNLSPLFYNSWGTLGMLTELSFEVLPLSQKEQYPHISLNNTNQQSLSAELQGHGPFSDICHRIKQTFDPDNILPVI